MTTETTRGIIDRYFAALARKDFDAIRPLLHDDVTFAGVMGTTTNADEYIAGLRGTTAKMTKLERRVVCADGDEVCQFYDMTLSEPATTLNVAQWVTVRDGRIAAARAVFDPRALLG